MEKLSLEKFQDVKLDNKQLSFVHAGDTCTGGGGSWTPSGIRIFGRSYGTSTSWTSDSVDENGNTSYSNFLATTGWY